MTAPASAARRARRLALTLLVLASAAGPGVSGAAVPCLARSGADAPIVVELYTSEGCSSCPPADRWLSKLKGREGVVALAFHVDYWDGLGWKDRFAQPQFTQRQNATQHTSGARFAYTPQVIVDGRDAPDWHALAARPRPAAPAAVSLQLAREDGGLVLAVTPAKGAPAALSGYVAVVDDGLQSQVRAGENRGETLRHDGVVRELLPWNLAGGQAATLHLASTAAPPEPGSTRHWVAVATDGAYGRPLQAVVLACTR